MCAMNYRRASVRAPQRESIGSPRSPGRQIYSVQTKRTVKMFQPENAPTSEEIGILKREKHNLIQEKSLLKAKISRLIDITKHPERYSSKANSDQNSLEREYRQVEQLSAAKRTEIATLNASDLAAIVNELQEECLMLHMELIRVKAEKNKADCDLRAVTRQLQDAKTNFHPDLERKQKRILRDLDKQVTEQRVRNNKIKAKLDDKEQERMEHGNDSTQNFINQSVIQLEAKIKQEQREIKALEEDIKELDETKQKEIEELKRQLANI